MRNTTQVCAALALAVGLAACGDALVSPPAVPATPQRVANSAVQAPEGRPQVLVAPGSLAATTEEPAPAQEVVLPGPELQAPRALSTPPAPREPGVAKSQKAPLAKDRNGKVMGRGPTKANRPVVNQGGRTGKEFVPFRGRKVRKPGEGAGEGKAKAKRESEVPAKDPDAGNDPRR